MLLLFMQQSLRPGQDSRLAGAKISCGIFEALHGGDEECAVFIADAIHVVRWGQSAQG